MISASVIPRSFIRFRGYHPSFRFTREGYRFQLQLSTSPARRLVVLESLAMRQGMDIESLERMLAEARLERDRAQADKVALADADARYHEFTLAVQGLEAWLERIKRQGGKGAGPVAASRAVTAASNGQATKTGGWESSYVRPREAILRIFDEAPGDWSLVQIEDTMRERKWLDPTLSRPTEAIRAAANRLVDVDRKLTRVGKSSYRLAIADLLA